ncbi:MAG: hypothetical protein V4549_03705, partial [Bacteroidota bacterium]
RRRHPCRQLEREGEMHQLVAIKTGLLDSSIATDEVVDRGDLFSIDVGSQGVFYAPFVELGIGRIFNYHRRGRVVWVGNGQHFIERSLENKMADISAKIKEARIS